MSLVSFERSIPVNDAHMNAEVKVKSTGGKRGFELPFFGLPKMEMPGILNEIAEQNVTRAKENCEKMRTASGEVADVFRQAYSTNAKSAADYGLKIIEISTINANSNFDFFTSLIGTRSLSDIMALSAAHARKTFDVASAQNKELWDLAQRVATETAEPIRNSVTKVLQKVA